MSVLEGRVAMALSVLLYALMVCTLAAFVGVLVVDAARSWMGRVIRVHDAARSTKHPGAPRLRERYPASREI
jgi:hypothetical protein